MIMRWLKKLFNQEENDGRLEDAMKFMEKICEALRNLGEVITYSYSKAYSTLTASTGEGLRRIEIDVEYNSGLVRIRIPALQSGIVLGARSFFTHIDVDYGNMFLDGRKNSEIVYPRKIGQKNPEEIAKEYLDLANEFNRVIDELRKIQGEAIEKKAKIDQDAKKYKDAIDLDTRQRIRQL